MNNEQDLDLEKLFDDNNFFKPITEGLGFHHSLKTKEEAKKSLKEKSIMLKDDFDKRAEALMATEENNFNQSIHRGDLSPFYNELITKINSVEDYIEEKIEVEAYSVASLGVRAVAWGIDFFIVASMFALTVSALVLSSGFGMNAFYSYEFLIELSIQTAPLFVFYYLFYFSFLDKTYFSSIGKRVLGLRVVDEDREAITMFQGFVRGFLTLISLGTLGLLSLGKFQDKLTGTIVIRD